MSSFTKISISLPVDLAIKVDLERADSYQTRSSWIKEAIEEKLKNSSKDSKGSKQKGLFERE
jgi:metal-responsive CopG/Arc/MetJ family transcriptional regulator